MEKVIPFDILGKEIKPGTTERLSVEIAQLYIKTPVQIPIIVSHSKKAGPTLLLMAGTHGDEVNGVEVVRRLIFHKTIRPDAGTIICLPVFNLFGFLDNTREFPDGRDLNRSFPGFKNGSLASRFAYFFTKNIAPKVDMVMDFHTGGAQRANFPQVRCDFKDEAAKEMCRVFQAPYTIHSSPIKKSVRKEMMKLKKPYIIFEGGKSNHIDERVVEIAVAGAKRVMHHYGLRKEEVPAPTYQHYILQKTHWIRAKHSGMLLLKVKNGATVQKGDILATIADPFGQFEKKVKAPYNCVIFNVNEMPLVNQGDALFNIGKVK